MDYESVTYFVNRGNIRGSQIKLGTSKCWKSSCEALWAPVELGLHTVKEKFDISNCESGAASVNRKVCNDYKIRFGVSKVIR